MQNYRCQNFRVRYRDNYRNNNFERGRSRSRKANIEVILEGMTEAAAVGLDQV